MAKINHITKFTFKNGTVHFKVFYNSGRKRTVFEHQLTESMIEVLLNGICTNTEYYETGKVEYFCPC